MRIIIFRIHSNWVTRSLSYVNPVWIVKLETKSITRSTVTGCHPRIMHKFSPELYFVKVWLPSTPPMSLMSSSLALRQQKDHSLYISETNQNYMDGWMKYITFVSIVALQIYEYTTFRMPGLFLNTVWWKIPFVIFNVLSKSQFHVLHIFTLSSAQLFVALFCLPRLINTHVWLYGHAKCGAESEWANIIQIKICAEYRDMLPRPRLVCQEPGLSPIGRSPGVPDKSSRGLGSMSRYPAQILICFITYIFQKKMSFLCWFGWELCRTASMHSAICHCPL